VTPEVVEVDDLEATVRGPWVAEHLDTLAAGLDCGDKNLHCDC
jgi:hypothetical protein